MGNEISMEQLRNWAQDMDEHERMEEEKKIHAENYSQDQYTELKEAVLDGYDFIYPEGKEEEAPSDLTEFYSTCVEEEEAEKNSMEISSNVSEKESRETESKEASIVETEKLKKKKDSVKNEVSFNKIESVSLDKIKVEDQPRKNFELDSLVTSIEKHGILEPIIVDVDYMIIHGERRFQAAQKLGLKSIPCIVKSKERKQEKIIHQLIENMEREDISPVEKGEALVAYKEQEKVDWSVIEELIGLSESRRKQLVSLTNLPEDIKKDVVGTDGKKANGKITEKHAKALTQVNPKQRSALKKAIKKGKLSGDDAIKKAKEMSGKPVYKIFKIEYETDEDLLQKLEDAVIEVGKRISGTE